MDALRGETHLCPGLRALAKLFYEISTAKVTRNIPATGKKIVNKNRKYRKNNKFGKGTNENILVSKNRKYRKNNKEQSDKGKEHPGKTMNFAKIAKVTKILSATTKCMLARTAIYCKNNKFRKRM